MNFLFSLEPLLAIGFPGGIEMLFIFGLILLLFGSARLPSLMRNIGRSAVEFKKGVQGIEENVDQATSDSSVESAEKAEKAEETVE